MIKKLIIILSFTFITNCNVNKVEKNHGVNLLDEKHKKLQINVSNKNDVQRILGTPSITGSFDKNTLIYIERKTSTAQLRKLGKKKLITNNVLILKMDNRGMLVKKTLLNKEDMKEINFTESETGSEIGKESQVYLFIKALRNKINDPLGTKRK